MTQDAIDALRVRLDGIIKGPVEDIYDPEFIRQLTIARESGAVSIVCEAKSRLTQKYKKDFSPSRLNALMDECEADFRAKLIAENPRQRYDWEVGLVRNRLKGDVGDERTGAIQMSEHNALIYFENHPGWKGTIGFNEFTAEHCILAPTPMPVNLKKGDALQDHHDTQILRWFQMETQSAWYIETIRRAVDVFAHQHSFHPIRAFLDALVWDGKPRLDTWLFEYAGAGPAEGDEKIDEALMKFYAAAGERWMISAVARIRCPGSEVHYVLVLEGGEGLGKSMLVKLIGKGWSQVMTGALDGKAAQELVASAVWIWELSELASFAKTANARAVKAFITKPDDTFRPAYGRRPVTHKRECAFIATGNSEDYLGSDGWEDGKRRIWPIRCTRTFDLAGLEENIDQLWAEADFKFKRGDKWHFDRDEDAALIATAKEEQAARVPEPVLLEKVIGAARECADIAPGKFCGTTTPAEILEKLEILLDKWDSLTPKVERCLSAGGWTSEKMPRSICKKQLRRWSDVWAQVKKNAKSS